MSATLHEIPYPAVGPRLMALNLSDVSKLYPGDPPVRALDGVSLNVEKGELCAIVGPSGSGKSTLLHVTGTLERPTSGRVSISGLEVSSLSDRHLSGVRATMIGFVFQQFFLLEHLTALDNVGQGLLYSGLTRGERRERAEQALRQVGLGHRLRQMTNTLSGGERQRVAIARAIVHEPAIVLADEPTGNLDSRSGSTVVDLLFELNRRGTTILVITHDQHLAEQFPRQISIRDGRVEYDRSCGEPESAVRLREGVQVAW